MPRLIQSVALSWCPRTSNTPWAPTLTPLSSARLWVLGRHSTTRSTSIITKKTLGRATAAHCRFNPAVLGLGAYRTFQPIHSRRPDLRDRQYAGAAEAQITLLPVCCQTAPRRSRTSYREKDLHLKR